MVVLLNHQFVMKLILGKVSSHHILKTGPPNYKPVAQVLPVATSAKCSKHGTLKLLRWTFPTKKYPLFAWLCDRWWPDFVTFTACKKSGFGQKGAIRFKQVQRFIRAKKYFGVRCTLNEKLCMILHIWFIKCILCYSIID